MEEKTFILVLVVAFAVVFPLVSQWIKTKYGKSRDADDPRHVLETRYALGEIDDAEFEHKMRTLTEQRVSYAKKTVRKGLEV